MTYLERLSPWCIVKLLPNMQRQVVARCRRRNDAEEHMHWCQLKESWLGGFRRR